MSIQPMSARPAQAGRAGEDRPGAVSPGKPARSERSRLPLIRRRLLRWYAGHGRDLPWRRTRDPYAVLVAEIMLQQTQVDRVIPKYHQFLERFPTLEALAAASRAEVIRIWAPLGHNRRAVRLHELAQQVVGGAGARLPSRPEELAKLGGLGPYTAAAVACFAFGHQVAVLDTNVKRVVSRLLADRLGPEPRPRHLEAAAQEIMPIGRAWDWNQAMMDLGATVCTARAPSCYRCPVNEMCASRASLSPRSTMPPPRAAEARAPYRASEQYSGSSRFFRGRIVQRLRELGPNETLSLDELGGAVRDDYSAAQRGWLLGLVQRLDADGLLKVHRQGDPAEELAGSIRVGLP